MRAGQRVIFHHISKSAGTSMVHLLQRNYPGVELLEVYDRRDQRAPDPTPQAFAAYLASLEPEVWDQVRCLTGHSVNFAIPVLTEPFRVFTIIRDPVDRAVSLYHYLKGRDGFGERGGLAGQLIRARGWSIADIYQNFGGGIPKETGEHQLFAGFFNGQTRTILAPHFPVDQVQMADGRPEAPPGLLDTLDLVLSAHYLIGSASRYGATVKRFAAEFDWPDTTLTRDNVTQDRPALEELPADVITLIRSYNALDDDLHQRALEGLADIPDPPSPPRSNPKVVALTEKLKEREEALTRAKEALARSEKARVGTEEALTRAEEARAQSEKARVGTQEALARAKEALARSEKARVGTEEALTRAEEARAHIEEARTRSEEARVRAEESLARTEKARVELGATVQQNEQTLAQLQQTNQELSTKAQDQERELTGQRAELTRMEAVLHDERAEKDRLRLASAARDRGMQALIDELEERKQLLAGAAQTNRELDATAQHQETELQRQRAELARLESSLDDERSEQHQLRETAAAAEDRAQALGQQLEDGKQSLDEALALRVELEVRVEHQESELVAQRAELSRLLSALEEEREEHNRLRGASAARDRRLQKLTAQLEDRKQALDTARKTSRELSAAAQQRAREFADLRGLLSALAVAGRRVASDLGFALSDGGEALPEHDAALVEAMLDRARLALVAAEQERRELGDGLEARTAEVMAAAERERKLVASVGELEAKLAGARADDVKHQEAVQWLLGERRRMVGHARGVVASRAWRYGHGASRLIRQVSFRPGKKRGAAEVLLAMLEAPPQLPAGEVEDSSG